MIDLAHPNIQDFKHIETPQRNAVDKQPMHSYFKVKPRSYMIPRTEHKITKLILTDFSINNKGSNNTFAFRMPSVGGVEL